MMDYVKKYNDFTRQIMGLSYSDNLTDNIVLSPLSILILLSMLASATNGETRKEILSCIDEGCDYNQHLSVINNLTSPLEKSLAIHSANAVGVRIADSQNIKPEYISELGKHYSGEFFSSSKLIDDVNAWVDKNTNGMIKGVADESMANVIAFLINAISFESEWEEKYEEEDIHCDDFTNADETKTEVSMLYSMESMYIENELFTGFLKGYQGREFSFMGILPKEKGNNHIVRCLNGIDFTNVYKSAYMQRVSVTMPEFQYSNRFNITDYCNKLGINRAFTSKADFSAMTTDWLMIEQIIHAARIEHNRKGTKASAVTTAALCYGAAPSKNKTIILNRPFIYAVMDNETKLPLFTGVMNTMEENVEE